MYTLENKNLTVSILDPVADVDKLGSRYCTGGYIWQVTDAAKGPLLAGPHYPSPTPPVFDGQGAPEMFHRALVAEGAKTGDQVMCIGVGLVHWTSEREPFDVRTNPDIAEYVKWKVKTKDKVVKMTTRHSTQNWAYKLVRKVVLKERTVYSKTKITNTGETSLPVRWFPHPFFPLPADNVLCKFDIPTTMPDSPGYEVNDDGFVCRKANFNWARGGCYQPFDFTPGGNGISTIQKHDTLGQVTAVTDYDPSFLPIWGNQNTFSFEPYLERVIEPGQKSKWEISYQF